MADERTLPLNALKTAWVAAHPFYAITPVEEREAEFDRAVAARDRATRESALEEAALEEAAQIAESTVVAAIAHVPNARATRIAALLRAAVNQTGEPT